MKIFIKNMVCDRCIMAVQLALVKLGLVPVSVTLGEAELQNNPDTETLSTLAKNLSILGFEILDERKNRLTEKVKTLIIDLVHSKNNALDVNLSDYITRVVPQDYNYTSTLFSQLEGSTIEQYYILQKIERVKELLVYDELTLSEIAFLLRYSSASHLSRQFRKVTGMTVTAFKELKVKKRQPLDYL